MNILGVDPSSTCIGAGLIILDDHGNPRRHCFCLRLTRPWEVALPPETVDAPAQEKAEMISKMAAELEHHLSTWDIAFAVVEWPSANNYQRGRNTAGLQIYGAAVGAVWYALRNYTRIAVTPEKWIAGQNKLFRQNTAVQMFENYSPDALGDRVKRGPAGEITGGGDVSDALCLAAWFGRRLTSPTWTMRGK